MPSTEAKYLIPLTILPILYNSPASPTSSGYTTQELSALTGLSDSGIKQFLQACIVVGLVKVSGTKKIYGTGRMRNRAYYPYVYCWNRKEKTGEN